MVYITPKTPDKGTYKKGLLYKGLENNQFIRLFVKLLVTRHTRFQFYKVYKPC